LLGKNNELANQLKAATEIQKLHEEELKAYKIKVLALERTLA